MAVEPTDLPTQLAALVDRDAATQVVYRYVDRVDALDIDGVTALFLDDASVELLGSARDGAEAIGRHLTRALGLFTATSHHVTNPLVTLDGDRAEVSAGVYAYHRRRSGEWWHIWGRYQFLLERGGDGWRIRHLQLVGIDGSPDADPVENDLYTGHPDRRDQPEQ